MINFPSNIHYAASVIERHWEWKN